MKYKEFLMLQLFADGGETDPPSKDQEGGGSKDSDPEAKDQKKTETKPGAKYTDEDVKEILNSKFDEWIRERQKKEDEAKRLENMTAKEKEELENEELRKKVDDLLKKEALSNMSKVARNMLSEKGINISDDLLLMMVVDDADKTKAAVESFANMFQDEVKKAVANALKGEPPKKGDPSGITKEQIMKVENRAERQRLIRENMHLFNK